MSVTKRTRNKGGRKVTFYQAEVYIAGERVAGKSFPTAGAANAWHEAQKKAHEAGFQDPGAAKTFGAVVAEYQNTAFRELRRSSQQARASRFPYLTEAPLAHALMKHVDDKAVDEWLRWLKGQATANRTQRATFRQELKLLSVVLNWYRNELDYCFKLPILQRHYKAACFKVVPARQQDYYMQPDQVIAWLQALKLRPDPVYGRLALLMVLTGLRMGEAAGLCWDAVEIAKDGHSCLRVKRTLSWDYRTKEAYFQDEGKNSGSIRTIPIEGAVVAMLLELRAMAKPMDAAPVFLTARGTLLRDNTIRDNFNTVFATLNLNWSGTHIARHTFATLALISERDIGAVQAALGHASQRITAGYAKVVALQSSRVSGNVARMIGLQPVDHVANHVSPGLRLAIS